MSSIPRSESAQPEPNDAFAADTGSESVQDGAEPSTGPKAALKLARDRVAQRLGAGRTALPPDLGGGLFALPAPAGSALLSSQTDRVRTDTSFVASFGDTPERRANLSFLPPGISARAEALTQGLDALFLRHTGSADRSHDLGGMPIQSRTYPNLFALKMRWRELADTALRLGELYRLEAERDPKSAFGIRLSEVKTRWDQECTRFAAVIEGFEPDDPGRVAQEKQRWAVIQSLGARLQPETTPDRTPAPPGASVAERQLAIAQRDLALLDTKAHEAAVAHIVDQHPELLTTPPDQALTEELISEYRLAFNRQCWKQSGRARQQELVRDLLAPVAEQPARVCKRKAADIRTFLDALHYPHGKATPRNRRDWLEDALAQHGFGTRFGQSLPKFDRWMRQHFSWLSVLALRKGRTYLCERIAVLSSLPPVTAFDSRHVETHLKTLIQAYEEASESLLEAAKQEARALEHVREMANGAEVSLPPPRLVADGYDFRSSFPETRTGVRDDKPDEMIPDGTWVAALHETWTFDLWHAQGEIRAQTSAISNPVNPKTGRKLTKLDPRVEREHRDALWGAKRTVERILVDYRGRFGVAAARAFSDHLEWLGLAVVSDLAMNARPPEEAAHRARLLEWVSRYAQLSVFQTTLSAADIPPGAKTARAAEIKRRANLKGICEQLHAEQAQDEGEYRDAHGAEALDAALRQVRAALLLRGVPPELPNSAPNLRAPSEPTRTVDSEKPAIDPRTTAQGRESSPAIKAREDLTGNPGSDPPAAESLRDADVETEPTPRRAAQEAPVRVTSTEATDSPLHSSETVVSEADQELIWNSTMPIKENLAQYTLLIRAPEDERFEKRRRGVKAGGQIAWRGALAPAKIGEWTQRIRQVLTDGVARSFNRIVLEASEGKFTADIAAGKAPETALWLLLPQGEVQWANHPGGYVVWRTTRVAAGNETQTALSDDTLPAPQLVRVALQEPVQEVLTTVRHVFASGMTRPVDMAGAIEAAHPFGVDVGLLSTRARKGVIRAVTAGVPVFADSGAFRLFKANLGLTPAQIGQLAFIEGCGKGLDDQEVMKRYAGLVSELGKDPAVNLEHLYLVAPDVVGSATETLRLLRKHKSLLAEFLDVGANVIVPLQRDLQLSFVEMAKSAVQILAKANVSPILGVPTQESVMQEADLRDLLRQLRPPRIHLLGSAAAQTAGRRLEIVRQHNDETEVTMDGNLLRSRLDEIAGLAGEARSRKIAGLLVQATAGKQQVTAQAFMDASTAVTHVIGAASVQETNSDTDDHLALTITHQSTPIRSATGRPEQPPVLPRARARSSRPRMSR
jgi:hypothetical protein